LRCRPIAGAPRIDHAVGIVNERCKLQALGLSTDTRVLLLSHLDDRDARHASALWPCKKLIAEYTVLRQALVKHLTSVNAMPLEQALRETLLLGRTAVSQLVRDPMLTVANFALIAIGLAMGLSESLCSGHSMTIRSMYAKQTEAGNASVAHHSPRADRPVRQRADERGGDHGRVHGVQEGAH
jgi:hypothetical protein